MSDDNQQLETSPVNVQLRGIKRNRPDDSPDAKSHLLSKKLEMCDHCSKEFTASCEVLQCDLCASLVHASCEGVDKEHFQLLSQVTNKISNVMYYCKLNNCVARSKQFIFKNVQAILSSSEDSESNETALRSITEEQEEIRDALTALSAKVDDLCSLNQTLESEIKATAGAVVSKPSPVVGESLFASPVEAVDEYLDRERRKCNLVIYNLPEPIASNVKDRTQQDKNVFSQLVSSELKIENINLLKCIRLGKKTSNNKARPLLVSVTEASTKYNILKKASQLRHSSSHSKVYISPDMTRKEREAAKELRTELKRRLAAGEKDLTIRQGKIVQKVATNMDSENST